MLRKTFLGLIFFVSAASVTGYCQESLASGIASASSQLAEAKLPDGATLAVLDFRDIGGGQTPMGRYVAEELATRLIQMHRFNVVERTRIDSVLQELKLADVEQQLVVASFAEKFRGLVGADYLVVGSLFKTRDQVNLNARIIETLTGKIHSAAVVRFRLGPDGDIDTSVAAAQRQSSAGVTITLSECRRTAHDVLCRLNVGWVGAGGRLTVASTSKVLDGGRQVPAAGIIIRDVSAPSGVNATAAVDRDGTVPVALRFPGVSGDSLRSLTIEVRAPDRHEHVFTFSDVPIVR